MDKKSGDHEDKGFFGSFFSLLFPPLCPLCKGFVEKTGFCGACISGFKKIEGPICGICGIPFASENSPNHTCGECIKNKAPFVKARSAYQYEGKILDAIHLFKYNADLGLALPLSELTARALDFGEKEKPDIITPVPLHRKRLKKRGFNQSLILARHLAKILGVSEVDCLHLERIRHTLPQTNLRERERRINVKGAFSVKDPSPFKNKRVLLVDDVLTTGATVRECSKVLKKAGAEVFIVTLARVF